MPDEEVAARIGRSRAAVRSQRVRCKRPLAGKREE
jgi:hypothetical protein